MLCHKHLKILNTITIGQKPTLIYITNSSKKRLATLPSSFFGVEGTQDLKEHKHGNIYNISTELIFN